METQSFITNLEKLLAEDDLISVGRDAQDLKGKFYDFILEQERKEQVKELEAKEKKENYSPQSFDDIKDQFKNLFLEFQSKRKKQLDLVKILEEENLKQKNSLLVKLKMVIEEEENIGAAFSAQKEIHEAWKKIGDIPRSKRDGIQKEYSRLMELFFYNINIYRELKENDYQRNAQLKSEKISQIQNLLGVKSIKEMESLLREYQNDWEGIGPVPNIEWEQIKKSYWQSVKAVYEKINAYYNERRSAMIENIDRKKALIEELKLITEKADEIENLKQWSNKTEQIKGLQLKWKQIGFGPKKENEAVWKEFRSHCDLFFEKRNAFNKAIEDQYAGVVKQKQALIEEAEKIKDSTDWDISTRKFISLQKEWKKIGNAGPRNENKLWKQFRKKCDYFFKAKDVQIATLEKEKEQNVAKYDALIQSVIAFKKTENLQSDTKSLKEFHALYKKLGPLPKNKVSEINKAFKDALDHQYDSLDIEPEKKELLLFKAKIDSISSGDNRTTILQKEKTSLRKNIDKITSNMLQMERNLSFFTNSKGANKLKEETQEKINAMEQEINKLKRMLKAIPNE